MTEYVIGADELVKRLQDIEKSVQPKIVAQALRSAMMPMLRQARAGAPQGEEAHRTNKGRLVAPGFLKRNIKLRRMRFKDQNRVGWSLAARGEAWYGRLLETGWRPGKRSRLVKAASRRIGALGATSLGVLGDRRGTVPPDPWLGRAERITAGDVDSRFRSELLRRIERAKR